MSLPDTITILRHITKTHHLSFALSSKPSILAKSAIFFFFRQAVCSVKSCHNIVMVRKHNLMVYFSKHQKIRVYLVIFFLIPTFTHRITIDQSGRRLLRAAAAAVSAVATPPCLRALLATLSLMELVHGAPAPSPVLANTDAADRHRLPGCVLPFRVYPGRAATHLVDHVLFAYSLTTWSPELPEVGFAGIEDAGGARPGLRRGGRSRAFQPRWRHIGGANRPYDFPTAALLPP